jgi:copper transport protein
VSVRACAVLALAALLAGLVLPGVASAHAYLVETDPSASGVLSSPPRQVALTFSEAVEPRFAHISVTDSSNPPVQEAIGPVHRSASDPNTLVVALRPLTEGWYLVYWRAISVDGHPVRGAFTFAVGPNPGPSPQFVIPSITESAATPRLVVARWVVFLAMMAAIGLFVLRIAIARPVLRRVEGTTLRPVSVAFAIASAVAFAAIPVYLLLETAQFALRSALSVGTLVPLVRTSAFGRGFVDLWLCFALFVLAAGVALWVDRPERERRSVAELVAGFAAFAAAGAVLLVPGVAGHAAETAPRGLSVALDWLHLVAGSLWLGGLIGLLVLWWALPAGKRTAALIVCVPRFSTVAFVSVVVLLGSGIGATVLHLPIVDALWQTSYGKAILVKIALLSGAIAFAAVNLLRSRPRLAAARERAELGAPAAALLRRLVGGETLLVAGAVLAAAVLTSLAPPAKALAKESQALARVGPGRVAAVAHRDGYTLKVLVSPNRAAVPNSFALALTKDGKPVRGADVVLEFDMLDMQMQQQAYQLAETRPGLYSRAAPALVMVGHWGLNFRVAPRNGKPFEALVVDRAGG